MRTSTIAAALAAAVLLACGARAQERPPTLEERVAALEVELQMLTQRVEGRGSVAPSPLPAPDAVLSSRIDRIELAVDRLSAELQRLERQVDTVAREASDARRQAMSAERLARDAARLR